MRECIYHKRITPGTRERKKNEDFMRVYLVSNDDRNEMLLSLTSLNYCQSILDRQKEGDCYEDCLYVFRLDKKLELRLTGEKEFVQIYIKIQFFKMSDNENTWTLLISFHKAESELEYMFKNN